MSRSRVCRLCNNYTKLGKSNTFSSFSFANVCLLFRFLHRDIKPSNLAIGVVPNFDDLFLIDFGLCRSFRHENGRLRRPRDVAGFRGTLTYAPLACHRGEDMCRRDDLWSWLYMLIELATGKLAWHSQMRQVSSLVSFFLRCPNDPFAFQLHNEPFKVQVEQIGLIKREQNAKPVELMTGCAVEFLDLHSAISNLAFYEQPNYDLMLLALKKMLDRRQRPDKDGEKLDWEPGGRCHAKLQF